MKKKVLKCGYLILFALFTFISVQGTLHAAVISSLSDNFDSENGSVGLLNYNTFAPGTYTLTFPIGGSQRGDTNIVDVTVGNLSQTLTISSGDALALKSFTFTTLVGEYLTFNNRGETTKALS
jgi:hypothetical protein